MSLRHLPMWVWALLGIALVIGVNFILWLPRYTSATNPIGSYFCLTCHGTGETFQVGEESLVHPTYDEVGCTQCHSTGSSFPIKEGYRGGFTAQPGEVSSTCRGCHQQIVTDEQVDYKFNVQSVRIPHQLHLETTGAVCTDCHRNIAHDVRPVKTNRPAMEYCADCHTVTDPNGCATCHPRGLPVPGANLTMSSKEIGQVKRGRELYQQNCLSCHGASGDQVAVSPLGSREYLASLGDRRLATAILEGKNTMLAFGTEQRGNLVQEDVRAIVAYLKAQAIARPVPLLGKDAK